MGFKWVAPGGGDRSGKGAVPSPVKSHRLNGQDAPDDEGATLGNEGKSSGAPISASRVDAPANIQRGSKARKGKKTFEERIDELRVYKAEHGHLNVKQSENKSMSQFCCDMRYARRNPESRQGRKLTADRIASLDALEFDWGPQIKTVKSFQERIDDLQAYKAKHGHLKVKADEDRSLYRFCVDMRHACRNSESTLTEDRIASLDALGFDWGLQQQMRARKTFKDRAEELQAYREKNGHINVKEGEDKSLYGFCRDMRYARGNPDSSKGRKLTVERIASLNGIGFDWTPKNEKDDRAFQKRLEELKAYETKNGHLDVKKSEDKSLY
ncbi:hypothetical protein ACHAXT_010904 [Thalassiosira profunda]